MIFDSRDIKVVWLDLDDTLIDFKTNSRRALHRLWAEEPDVRRCFDTAARWIDTYEQYNHALWAEYGLGRISRSYLRMERFRRPLVDGGLSDEEARVLAGRYDSLYLDFLAQEKVLIPGSIDLLRMLRDRGVIIGCLSNGFKDVQFRKIRNCGLESWFDLVVLSDDIGINKPDSRIFEYAMERSGVTDPKAHLMVGDNPVTDISGALGAGWSVIQFRREKGVVECEGCTRFADTLEEVSEMIFASDEPSKV